MAAPDSAAQTKSSAILWAAKRVAAHSPIARSAHHTWLRVRCRQRRWTWESWGGSSFDVCVDMDTGMADTPYVTGGVVVQNSSL